MDLLVKITDRSAINALGNVQMQAQLAIMKGLRRAGLLIGGRIANRAPRKSGRLARSFLVPVVQASSVILGRGVPIYGAIHEYGGTIRPVNGEFLTFPIGGQWVRTRQVQIKEKRFARGGLEEAGPMTPVLIGKEIAAIFNG